MANSHPGSYCGQDAYSDMFVTEKCHVVRGGNGQVNQSLMAEQVGTLNCMHDQQMIIGADMPETEYVVRRLTPTECARLQGFPDWWCADVPHADSAEYKLWGNGVALPCVLYVMEGIKALLEGDNNG